MEIGLQRKTAEVRDEQMGWGQFRGGGNRHVLASKHNPSAVSSLSPSVPKWAWVEPEKK